MDSSERPTYFYVFPKGEDFEIRQMTDVQAAALYHKGERWVGVAQKTRGEAEELRYLCLKRRKN